MATNIKAVIFDWAGTTIDYGCFAPIKGFVDGYRSIGIEISNEMARKPMGLLKIDHTRAIAAMLPEPISEEQILRAYEKFEETLFANIELHCDIKEHVIETVDALRAQGIKIGSTTGYTSQMMEPVLKKVADAGYAPDFWISPDMTAKGRPYPYMIWENLKAFGISEPREAIKVGDTTADIKEGKNANCWTVGVIMGSSELGFSRDEVAALSKGELEEHKKRVRASYYKAGADYIIDDMDELIDVVADINRKLELNADRKLLTPGPLTTRYSVKNAMLTDHCTWDDEYKAITTSVINDITNITANGDYTTVLLQGSGTYAVEAMLDTLTGTGETILFLVNGEYGRRMLTIADRIDRKYIPLEFNMTNPLDVEAVEEKLKETTDISTVAFVHCETTTGIINPLEDLVKLAKAYGKKVLVDAMSSFGAYDIDMPGLDIDALASSSNKCLEGLPGLGFVVVKKALLEECADNASSHSLDLYDQSKSFGDGNGKFRFTSPTNVLLALRQALDNYKMEGGLEARKNRYIENHKTLTEGLEKLGFKAVIPAEYQSHIITTFELGDLDFTSLYNALKEKGFVIYPGKLTEIPTFRLGNIGDVYPEDMSALVTALDEFLKN